VAIIGGAKVSDKIGVLQQLLNSVDKMIIGGGMANTFLIAKGFSMGSSLVEQDQVAKATEIIQTAGDRGVELLLPVDVAVADNFAADATRQVVELSPDIQELRPAIPDGEMALDIGPATVANFTEALRGGKTIVWNGPMGVFEFPNFAVGTTMIADAVAGSGAVTIIGGGETVAAVEQAGVADRITHISTGGGASLEFLEGKELPGVAALQDK
jgi:phosphoglycerate kinase